MSGDSGNRGAEFINDGDKSSDGINFSDGDSNPYSAILDAAYGPMEGRVEQNESVERTSFSGDPVKNWQDARGAAEVSCDAYCRSVNPNVPSRVDAHTNNVGYFGGGPEQVAQRPMTEIERYQQRQRASHRGVERQWRGNGGWDQGHQPVRNDGQTIVNISKGGQQGYNPGYNPGWGGGWQQGNQGGDSTTIVTTGGQEVSTGSDDIQYGDFGHSKSRTEVGGGLVAGNGNRSGIDNPTYNDQTARILGIGKVAERIGHVIRGNDRNNGDVYGNQRYGNGQRDIPWNGGGPYYGGGRQRDVGGRNTTIIVNGRGDVSTGSDDIRYGDFEYGKQRTEVGTPPYFPNGQRGHGHRGSRSGIDNPTYNDETARILGIGKVIERNIGAWRK